jgi:hypothetical protein
MKILFALILVIVAFSAGVWTAIGLGILVSIISAILFD